MTKGKIIALSKKIKKDFDRDKMYSKIMPSIAPDAAAVEELKNVPSVKKEHEPKLPPLEYSTPRLHNYMEDMLLEKLSHTMKMLRSCPCERCRLDVLAVALNLLPPAYAVADRDDRAERIKILKSEYEVKVTATLIKAIQQVKGSPRHKNADPPLV